MKTDRIPAATAALALLLALAACGTDAPPAEDAADTMDAPAETTTAADAGAPTDQPITASMVALEESGMGGTVSVDVSGAQPVLSVSLTGAPAAGVHQGHIHGGTCADRTGAIEPLEPITTMADGTGQATSTVELDAATLLDGNHIVVYHEADGSPGASLVCADIPAR